jgi:hypothetical protein
MPGECWLEWMVDAEGCTSWTRILASDAASRQPGSCLPIDARFVPAYVTRVTEHRALLTLRNEFADVTTMSVDHRSPGSVDGSSRSAPRKTGRQHVALPGLISELAVGFGIAKAISKAQRARFEP